MEGGPPRPEPGRRSPDDIVGYLASTGPAAVALSGGVDSSVSAWLLQRALGPRARAVTFSGSAVPLREVEQAREVARAIGIAHAVIGADPLGVAEYRSNPSNRCYFCRTHEAERLRAWGLPRGIDRFVDGIHLDDLGDDRPGLRAMDEAGFLHPLLWARWRKADVRAFARSVGLPNADRPSDACLASRVRHGVPITADLLDRVSRAEDGLHRRGFRRVRVRVDALGARIEVGADEVARLLQEPTATEVRTEVEGFGLGPVVLDPRGYRWRPAA